MFVVRQGVEAKFEESFAVALTDGRWEEESKEALLVMRVRMSEEASEEPEGSHFDGRWGGFSGELPTGQKETRRWTLQLGIPLGGGGSLGECRVRVRVSRIDRAKGFFHDAVVSWRTINAFAGQLRLGPSGVHLMSVGAGQGREGGMVVDAVEADDDDAPRSSILPCLPQWGVIGKHNPATAASTPNTCYVTCVAGAPPLCKYPSSRCNFSTNPYSILIHVHQDLV